jgi:general secretion pathway protein C
LAFKKSFVLAEGLIGCLLVAQIIRLTLLVVTPLGPLGDWQPTRPVRFPAAARQAIFARFDPFYRDVPMTPDAGGMMAGPVHLYGVHVNADTGSGTAILALGDGEQKLLGLDELVAPGIRLAAIAYDHVEIDRAGQRERVFLTSPDTSGIQPPDMSGTAHP